MKLILDRGLGRILQNCQVVFEGSITNIFNLSLGYNSSTEPVLIRTNAHLTSIEGPDPVMRKD